jgi:hypothetical protein
MFVSPTTRSPDVGLIHAADQIEQRRLARARGAHERDVIAIGDVERQTVEHDHLLGVAAIHLAHIAHMHGSHRPILPIGLSARRPSPCRHP